nr:membrane protein insertion efficiency factor YidD [Pseudovibrio flavus]
MNCYLNSSQVKAASTQPLGRVTLGARVGIALIWVYQHSLSLFAGRGCRYAPTCSYYTAEAMRRYGFWRGGWVGLARLMRCGPWGASGFDPVPETLPEKARWYMPWRYGQWGRDHIDKSTRLDLD